MNFGANLKSRCSSPAWMCHVTTCTCAQDRLLGERWRPFAFWFLQNRRNWENMFEWGIWCMFWLLLSSPTKTMIHQISNVASSAHPRVIFFLFLAHFDFSLCCLDDYVDCRISVCGQRVSKWYVLFCTLPKSKIDFRWFSHPKKVVQCTHLQEFYSLKTSNISSWFLFTWS